jgi:hypothetical protein
VAVAALCGGQGQAPEVLVARAVAEVVQLTPRLQGSTLSQMEYQQGPVMDQCF